MIGALLCSAFLSPVSHECVILIMPFGIFFGCLSGRPFWFRTWLAIYPLPLATTSQAAHSDSDPSLVHSFIGNAAFSIRAIYRLSWPCATSWTFFLLSQLSDPFEMNWWIYRIRRRDNNRFYLFVLLITIQTWDMYFWDHRSGRSKSFNLI
jgi:hypothetical protein